MLVVNNGVFYEASGKGNSDYGVIQFRMLKYIYTSLGILD